MRRRHRRFKPLLSSLSLEPLRLRLAGPETLLWSSLLGLLTGLVAGSSILAFRLAVEGAQTLMLPGHGENFEGLPMAVRLLLPLVGSVPIGWLFLRLAKGSYVLGVARVMERMEYHQGYLSWRGSSSRSRSWPLNIGSPASCRSSWRRSAPTPCRSR